MQQPQLRLASCRAAITMGVSSFFLESPQSPQRTQSVSTLIPNKPDMSLNMSEILTVNLVRECPHESCRLKTIRLIAELVVNANLPVSGVV